ncbi:MAG: 2-C-methyl-D-erythritol 2,4-cyclodiphosphate synthase [Porphyromonas sp.]|nr:2-C-methyl-D-erythritol 2,4-cyclodiphosphate synthase [Porphyromonas sp.]
MGLNIRVGFGYDIHRLVPDRDLIIGGVRIDHHLGLLGHSDADVLLHAISDALLGAANLRDIGYHFPDTDPKYKGADSLFLLEEVARLLEQKGYRIGNIDSTVIAQAPKLNPHIPKMQAGIARVLNIPQEDISIKATTHEKLDATGHEEGIAAMATALIYRD